MFLHYLINNFEISCIYLVTFMSFAIHKQRHCNITTFCKSLNQFFRWWATENGVVTLWTLQINKKSDCVLKNQVILMIQYYYLLFYFIIIRFKGKRSVQHWTKCLCTSSSGAVPKEDYCYTHLRHNKTIFNNLLLI